MSSSGDYSYGGRDGNRRRPRWVRLVYARWLGTYCWIPGEWDGYEWIGLDWQEDIRREVAEERFRRRPGTDPS